MLTIISITSSFLLIKLTILAYFLRIFDTEYFCHALWLFFVFCAFLLLKISRIYCWLIDEYIKLFRLRYSFLLIKLTIENIFSGYLWYRIFECRIMAEYLSTVLRPVRRGRIWQQFQTAPSHGICITSLRLASLRAERSFFWIHTMYT